MLSEEPVIRLFTSFMNRAKGMPMHDHGVTHEVCHVLSDQDGGVPHEILMILDDVIGNSVDMDSPNFQKTGNIKHLA